MLEKIILTPRQKVILSEIRAVQNTAITIERHDLVSVRITAICNEDKVYSMLSTYYESGNEMSDEQFAFALEDIFGYIILSYFK